MLIIFTLALALVGQSLALTPICNNVNLMWNGSQCVPSCPKLNVAIAAQKQQAVVTSFCSAYLNIPIITSTVTSTSTLSTTSTSTYTSGLYTTTDSTVTIGATATNTLYTTVTSTVGPTTTLTQTACVTTSMISSCAAAPTAAVKRRGMPVAMAPAAAAAAAAAANVHKPVILAGFNAGPALSSACACLSVSPSTTILTASTSSTLTIPASTTIPTTIHATSTKTVTSNTVTTTSTIKSTTTTTQTVMFTTTSSVNGLAFPTFAVRVKGGDRAGNYISNSGTSIIDSTATTPANGLAFSLSSGCNLYVASGTYSGNEIVQDAAFASDPQLYINSGIPAPRLRYFTCDVQLATDGTCPMTCTGALNGGTSIWDCGVYWRIGLAVPSGCYGWTPLVVGSI